MSAVDADSPFRPVVRKVDPRAELLRTWRLEGGVSARITALEIGRPGGHREKLVVRQYGDANLRANPSVAEDEFRVLETVRAAGVPAPRPRLADASGQILPRPYLVIDLVEGQSGLGTQDDVRGQVRELAGVLARIHGIPRSDTPFLADKNELLRRRLAERPARLDEALSEGGVDIAARVPLHTRINPENRRYLATKAARAGHWLEDMLEAAKPGRDAIGSPAE